MVSSSLIFNLIGGLALFIYGIQVMGEGLQKTAGEKVRYILKTLTKNPIMGVSVGAIITSIIQSSSATSVLAIGFVNAGLMQFKQALSIILGANIGTTVTAQIIAFKLTNYALPILAIGFLIYFVCKKRSWKNFGYFLLGLGILFLGLSIMTSAIKPFASSPLLKSLFIKYSSNPFFSLLIGIIATAIFQSSSATTGIIIALSSVNLITLQGAIPMIIGSNIGTCATALLASIGTSINAKRTAIAHLMFNLIGALIFMPFLGPFEKLAAYTAIDVSRQIANAHTIFNVVGTLILLPFLPYYAKLITKFLPGKTEEIDFSETKYLDSKLLATPSIAIEAATKEIVRMLSITQNMIIQAMKGLYNNNLKELSSISTQEEIVDRHRLSIIEYLTSIMERPLSHNESTKIPALMHAASDVERIGDHAENLMELASQKIEKSVKLSDKAIDELKYMQEKVQLMLKMAMSALSSKEKDKAEKILKLEGDINYLRNTYKNNHINRLNSKSCNALSGIVFLDAIANFEKIGDHLNNIGQAVLDGLQWKDIKNG